MCTCSRMGGFINIVIDRCTNLDVMTLRIGSAVQGTHAGVPRVRKVGATRRRHRSTSSGVIGVTCTWLSQSNTPRLIWLSACMWPRLMLLSDCMCWLPRFGYRYIHIDTYIYIYIYILFDSRYPTSPSRGSGRLLSRSIHRVANCCLYRW